MLKIKGLLITILLIIAFCCNNQLILKIDFEGNLNNKNVKRLLSHELIELNENEGVNKSNAIKVTYKGYSRGSKNVMRLIKLPIKLDEATLNYSVKFDKNFNFVNGGKLHGFVPENKIVGGKEMASDGWSARANFKKDGKIASYIYHQNKSKKWGDGYTSLKKVFTPGEYNEVSVYVKLNKPGSSKNGLFEIWVDGELIISHDSIQYRGVEGENTLISNFYFSTFHGGHSLKYAPTDAKGDFSKEYAWFDNLEVYKGKYIRFNKLY